MKRLLLEIKLLLAHLYTHTGNYMVNVGYKECKYCKECLNPREKNEEKTQNN